MQTLTASELNQVTGGDIVDVIDGACASIAVGTVFWASALAVPGAFCAGWTVGRLFSS